MMSRHASRRGARPADLAAPTPLEEAPKPNAVKADHSFDLTRMSFAWTRVAKWGGCYVSSPTPIDERTLRPDGQSERRGATIGSVDAYVAE